MVPLKYLSYFGELLKCLIISETNLILTWSEKCNMASNTVVNQETTFTITDTKLYVPVVTLSTQESVKLLQELKSGFKITIYWDKYQPKGTLQVLKPYLNYLFDPSFQEINRRFVLLFENTTDRTVHTKYYLPTVE